MILFYAFGGGLGHVSRSMAIADQLGFENYKILTAGGLAETVVPEDKLILIDQSLKDNIAELKSNLKNILESNTVNEIFIDSFPLGILGELREFIWPEACKKTYIARLIKWREYLAERSNIVPVFDRVIQIESLSNDHQAFLQENYKVEHLEIKKEAISQCKLTDAEHAVICHTGSDEELLELCSFAQEIISFKKLKTLKLFLISPHQPKGMPDQITWCSTSMARKYFGYAKFIFSACGFNMMNECEIYREKHYFLPFKRKFDDQFFRAAQYRRKN